jgi:hypothetical protein
VDSDDVSRWIAEYVDAFGSCGRGESDTKTMLEYYRVPLLVTTDDGVSEVTHGDQVIAMLQQQADAVHAAGYARSEIVDSEVTILNATSAFYRGSFSRQREDGSEISRVAATYLVTDGPDGRRISVLAVQRPYHRN